MNAAETSAVLTTLGCPVAAGLSAAAEKAGWYTVVFVVGGIALGLGGGFVVLKLANRLLRLGGRGTPAFLEFVFVLAYLLVPMVLSLSAILSTAGLTIWLVRHLL